jgi:hypothetical protein
LEPLVREYAGDDLTDIVIVLHDQHGQALRCAHVSPPARARAGRKHRADGDKTTAIDHQ